MSILLSDLQRRVADRMDETNSQYVAAGSGVTTMTDAINEAYSMLWGIYAAKDAKFLENEVTITPVANIRDYALPADFRSENKVYCLPSPAATPAISTHIAMRRTMRDLYQGVPNQASYFYPTGSYIPTFDIYSTSALGQVLRIDPTPVVTPQFAISVWYNQNYTPFVNLTDALDPRIYPGHEQYIVNEAAIILKTGKEEQDSTELFARQQRVEERINKDLDARFMGSGKRIVDTDGYDGWVRGWDGWY